MEARTVGDDDDDDDDDVRLGFAEKAPAAGGPGVEVTGSRVVEGTVAPGVAHHELVLPAITVVERPAITSPQVQ